MMSHDLLARCVCVCYFVVCFSYLRVAALYSVRQLCVCVCVCKVSQRVGNWVGEEASFCWHVERFGLETLKIPRRQIAEPVL